MTARRPSARSSELLRVAALVVTVAALTALSATADARSGGARDRQLSLARQSVALGNIDEAIRIYRQVLDADPTEERAFWGLAELYASNGMDREELVPLLTARLESYPDDFRASEELGAAYVRLGELDRAHETWMEGLRRGRPDEAKYSDIGQMELANRMLDQAVETYLEARAVFGRPEFFSEELVRAYAEMGRFDDAMDECVQTVEQHSGMVQWAVNRIEMMLDQGAERRDVEGRMDGLARSQEATPAVLSYVGSVYVVLGKPSRALDAFLRADAISADDGRALLDHAAILSEAGLADQAAAAYRAVQERHPDSVSAARAGVELGRGLAAEGRLDDALTALRETGQRYEQYSEGGDAVLEAAEIELHVLHDPAAAMSAVDDLLSQQRGRGKLLEERAKLLRVDALMALGRFGDAHDAAVELTSGRLHEALEERAAYALGFSSFLAGERRRALDEFRSMIEADPSGSLVNDALRLMLVIAEAEETGDSGPASLLAEAHLANLRGDEAGARAKLGDVIGAGEGGAAATEALLLLGAVEYQSGDYDAALATYGRVMDATGSMTARAEALMRSGDILLEVRKRPEEAIAKYTAILEELPTNALTGEARRKIDAIRKGRSFEG